MLRGMTGATAADYAWVEDPRFGLGVAYCLTLVRGIPPEEVLDRVGSAVTARGTGVESVVLDARFEERDGWTAAVTSLGAWTLMYEYNGYLGVTDSALTRLSRGTTAVGHFKNVNAVDDFRWYENGVARLRFQPLFPSERWGPEAEAIAGPMREVGFDLTDHLELDDDREDFGPVTRGAFALAERITGVRVTPELLSDSVFVAGRVRPKR